MQTIISIENGMTRMPEWNMAEPVNFSLCEGEHIAIVGPNAGGKTMFAEMITGAHPLRFEQPVYDFSPNKKAYVSDNIKYITFEDAYGSKAGHYYLQQRWNMHDIDAEMPTAKQELEDAFSLIKDKSEHQLAFRNHLYEIFGIEQMLDKYIISLSSGELRKLNLVKNLMAAPRVLMLDNPFIGLDAATREMLKRVLDKLIKELPLQLIIILSKNDDIPDFITHVVEVKELAVSHKMTMTEYFEKEKENSKKISGTAYIENMVKSIPQQTTNINNSDEVVRLNNICIKYGKRTILKDLCWTIKNGEHWALNGENGSGKSTLLSLICADNPQSYACDITLFGIPRGSGESIWEIKKNIGYVSPEMHRAYKQNISCLKIVASGINDSVGLYIKLTEDDYKKCLVWLDIFGISHLKDRNYLSISSGEQRMVLLARAFVKDPQLLILDEPFHGLDNNNRNMVRIIINAFAKRKNKTIVMVSHYKEEYPSCIDHELMLKKN